MIRLVKGFKDILPEETGHWEHVEAVVRGLFDDFGFAELRIPIVEKTELFARSIGANTDIVEKEMYTFADRSGTSLTLRPEATASVVRAYVEHKLYARDPVWKVYTIGPMFRRERPQKGRYRQFYQINAEVFGLHDARADAELILLLMTFMGRLELSGIVHAGTVDLPRIDDVDSGIDQQWQCIVNCAIVMEEDVNLRFGRLLDELEQLSVIWPD